MVRLSLVNLYLHGFVDPRISEYDTLTSEERWNEYADVILANPPFMSPEGWYSPASPLFGAIQTQRSAVRRLYGRASDAYGARRYHCAGGHYLSEPDCPLSSFARC